MWRRILSCILHHAGLDRQSTAAAPFRGSFLSGGVGRFLCGDGWRTDSHHAIERVSGGLLAARRRQQGHLDSVGRSGEPDDASARRSPAHSLQPRGGDLPSRIADDLFWLGRYVERAEAQVRLARAAYRRIIEENGFEEMRAAEILAASQRGLEIRRTTTSPRTNSSITCSKTRKAAESRKPSHRFRVWREFCGTGFRRIAGASCRSVTRAFPAPPQSIR